MSKLLINFKIILQFPAWKIKIQVKNNQPFIPIQSKHSLTEFSLKDRPDQFSYQPVGNELLKTPVFTGEGEQIYNKPIPTLSFERIHEYNEMQSKEGEDTSKNSVNFR